MRIEFIKCHGTGNDFVLIDEIKMDYGFTEEQRKELTLVLCSREGPIGADGILFVQRGRNSAGRMRIFNADGSEAEMCGNGLRCVGRYLMEVTGRDMVEVETMKGHYVVKACRDIYPLVKTIEIGIDSLSLEPDSLPMIHKGKRFIFERIRELSESLRFSAVSVTNPHIISIVDEIREAELMDIGQRANRSPHIFPRGVNVSFVKILDRQSIYVRTFERGVGITKSCGTGMTASSLVFCLYNVEGFGKKIRVYNDGGMVKCIVSANDIEGYRVRFIGNATFVYRGSFDLSSSENSLETDYSPYKLENKAYDDFLEHTIKSIS